MKLSEKLLTTLSEISDSDALGGASVYELAVSPLIFRQLSELELIRTNPLGSKHTQLTPYVITPKGLEVLNPNQFTRDN